MGSSSQLFSVLFARGNKSNGLHILTIANNNKGGFPKVINGLKVSPFLCQKKPVFFNQPQRNINGIAVALARLEFYAKKENTLYISDAIILRSYYLKR